MENNIAPGGERNRAARELLSDLESDRTSLAERLRRTRWLAPVFGLIAAAYIATPVAFSDSARNVVLIAALVSSITAIGAYRRVTGIKVSRFGFTEWVLFAGAFLATLLLFSVSLGFAASGLPEWITASAVGGFAAVTGLVSLLTASLRSRLRDVA